MRSELTFQLHLNPRYWSIDWDRQSWMWQLDLGPFTVVWVQG